MVRDKVWQEEARAISGWVTKDSIKQFNEESEEISSFHRELLQSVTFISRLMHSVIQNVDRKSKITLYVKHN